LRGIGGITGHHGLHGISGGIPQGHRIIAARSGPHLLLQSAQRSSTPAAAAAPAMAAVNIVVPRKSFTPP